MWELELLSRVVPAFGALAREYMRRMEDEQHDARLRNAQDCYQDISLIGHALHMSGGEWASGLDDIDVAKLLAAFETRFPKKWFFFPTWKPYGTPEVTSGARTQFPKLANVADSIESRNLGGYKECSEILSQSDDQHKRYVDILGPEVSLFRGSELADFDKCEKFLKRIRVAAKHLLNVYCREEANGEVDSLSLSQHPSHGAKEFADKLYKSLQRHWSCSCPHRAIETFGTREARLSLTRYRQFAPRVPRRPLASSSFEVVLPVCKSAEWKVTNFEVQSTKSQIVPAPTRQAVVKDLCQYLRKSGPKAQEYFLIEHEDTWHLRAELLEEPGKHASMEPLDQFLGNGVETSYISQCNPREQLALCYILATSMLYLYPSSWFSTEWTSNMVHFTRRSKPSTSPALTHPYVSIQLQDSSALYKPSDRHRIHSHPAILALGIILLEIASGSRFQRTREGTPTERCNEDNARAWEDFKKLERNNRYGRKRQIPSSLREAIRACLKLEPPANFPSNQLAEEGPIRHYILLCIVQPLAHELKDGYKIDPSDLHNTVFPGTNGQRGDGSHDPTLSRQSTVSIEDMSRVNTDENVGSFASKAQLNFASGGATSFTARQAACLYRDREELVDEEKVKVASAWFDWHNSALARLGNLRDPAISEGQRVKIAILDSGIDLAQNGLEMYNTDPGIQYRSWVDNSPEWKDEVGHGTHLAVLLRKIVPNAIVHVGRVFKKRPTKGSVTSISQAIRYAVDEWKVDMIVMSFGFGEEHQLLDDAIQYAAYKKVLMFAAASNDGKNRPGGVAWPAQHDSVICVHSADGNGNPSEFTPEARDHMRVMVLGECINSASPPHLKHAGDHRFMSGTSCAAPVAAGIAALILDYARGFLEQHEWEKLRRVQSIRRMFQLMKDPESRSEYWWIRHWVLFDPKRDESWIQGEIRRVLPN